MSLKDQILEFVRRHPGALYQEIAKHFNLYPTKMAGYLEAMRDYGDIEIKPAGNAMRCYRKKGEE